MLVINDISGKSYPAWDIVPIINSLQKCSEKVLPLKSDGIEFKNQILK